MKLFVAFVSVLFVGLAAGEQCSANVSPQCALNTGSKVIIGGCDAKYGAFAESGVPERSLQGHANKLLSTSYDYLLFATHFNTYTYDRPGFMKLFRSLSDKAFDDAINIIKHVTKRGGVNDFDFHSRPVNVENLQHAKKASEEREKAFDVYELHALSTVLDVEKELSTTENGIHNEFHKKDAEITQFLEEEFIEKRAGTVRQLSGYVNDLWKIMRSGDTHSPLGVFLFDQYLQKQ